MPDAAPGNDNHDDHDEAHHGDAGVIAPELAEYLRQQDVDPGVHHAVFTILRGAALMVSALEEFALRPLGLSHAGYRVLVELAAFGPREPRQLAAFMLVSRPAIVGTINTLERRGLVERIRSLEDRRLVTVRITEAGAEVAEQALRAWHEGQRRITQGLTAGERELAAELVRRIGDAAADLRGARAGR